MKIWACVLAVLCGVVSSVLAADWNEWRGPQRNGVAGESPALLDAWPTNGPKRVWDSEEKIPGDSNKSGGFGSLAVAGGSVYCFFTPIRTTNLTTRTLKEEPLKSLGWTAKKPPAEAAAKVEQARLSEERRALANPKEVAAWAQKWAETNLDADTRKQFGPYLGDRLSRGTNALDFAILDKLETIKDKPFPDAAALDKWLDDSAIQGSARKLVAGKFPATQQVRDNVLVCLDANTGKTTWKQTFPGETGGEYGSAATPCVAGGKCYVIGMEGRAHCLDAKTGEPVWQAQAGKGEKQCSFIVEDGVAIIPAGPLTGFDAATGKELWTNGTVAASMSSPVRWKKDGQSFVIVRAGGKIVCVEPKSGAIRWTINEGGADAHYSSGTPAVDGDRMAVLGNWGARVYTLSLDKADLTAKATCPTDYGASPLLLNGHVYVCGRGGISCVNAETGQIAWQDKTLLTGSYSSPVLADGKAFIQGNSQPSYGDGSLSMFSLSPEKGLALGRVSIKQTLCTTPAIVDGRIYCRLERSVACFDLRK